MDKVSLIPSLRVACLLPSTWSHHWITGARERERDRDRERGRETETEREGEGET